MSNAAEKSRVPVELEFGNVGFSGGGGGGRKPEEKDKLSLTNKIHNFTTVSLPTCPVYNIYRSDQQNWWGFDMCNEGPL